MTCEEKVIHVSLGGAAAHRASLTNEEEEPKGGFQRLLQISLTLWSGWWYVRISKRTTLRVDYSLKCDGDK